MLLMMIEKGMQIDDIINIDTTKEFPEMYKHIEKVKEYVLSKINIKIKIIKIDFDYWFSNHILTKGANKGRVGYGWPSHKFRWCSGLKTDAFRSTVHGLKYDKYKRNQGSLKYVSDCIIYIGYGSDEINRIKTLKNEVYPLINFNMTGKDCIEYCYDNGFDWGGLYEKMKRVSCYCCPLSSLSELEVLYNKYPNLWFNMKEMDKKSFRRFRSDYRLDQLEDRFKYNCLWKNKI